MLTSGPPAVPAGWQRVARLALGVDLGTFDNLAVAMRVLFFRFLLLMSLFAVPILVTGDTPAPWRIAGAVATAGLVFWWVRGRDRGFPAWTLVPEGVALAVLGVAVGDPLRALGVIYFALYFRAFHAPGWSAVGLGLTYVGAHLGAVAVADALGLAPQAVTLANPSVAMQGPGFVLVIVVIRVLVIVADRRAEDARRQAVLAELAVSVGAADDRAELADAVRDGAAALADQEGAVPVAFVLLRDGRPLVAASSDPVLVGREAADVQAAWPGATRVAVTVDGAEVGALLVSSTDRDLVVALASLASQAGLALARLESVRALQAREARFRTLIANASDVICMVDDQGTVIYFSEPVRRVLGHDPADLVGTSAFELVHPDDTGEMRGIFEAMLEHPSERVPALHCRLGHADGSWRDVEAVARNLLDDPAVEGLVVNFRDVTERNELEAELRHRALHDPLTDLPNRALFQDRVDHALTAQTRSGASVAVIFIDLDDFKTINDGLGHAAGDEVLRAVARRLRSTLRAADTCARLGGDEFGVLLVGMTEPHEAYEVATRILERLHSPVRFGDRSIEIDASAGIVVSTGGETADELVRNADLAMYRAKASGKGHYELFEIGMHEAVRHRLLQKADLERGVAAEEFVAHYQPIVGLDRSEPVVGVETLARWRHPEHGLLAPAAFMSLAEETGLVVAIGRQVIAQACRDAAAWSSGDGHPLDLNVNLSVAELQHPELHDFLAGVLAANDLDPQRMVVEITESMFVVDIDTAASALDRLKRLGVRIALDDFGTGYSPLAYLQQFPVDVVKIDKSFVDSLGDGLRESPLAGAILSLGRSLALDVTAEGVEHETQVRRLRQLGCERAQGYHFSKPLPAQAMGEFLQRRNEAALAS